MSNRSQDSGQQGGGQLFQNMDEQERTYAPQQVPGADIPAEEVDQGGTAGQTTAATEGNAGSDRETIAGAEGDPRTTPVIPVRPDVSANTPIMVPPLPATHRSDESDAPAQDRE